MNDRIMTINELKYKKPKTCIGHSSFRYRECKMFSKIVTKEEVNLGIMLTGRLWLTKQQPLPWAVYSKTSKRQDKRKSAYCQKKIQFSLKQQWRGHCTMNVVSERSDFEFTHDAISSRRISLLVDKVWF